MRCSSTLKRRQVAALHILAATICISSLAAQEKSDQKSAGIVIDKNKKTVTIPCKIALRKLPELSEVYPIEVIATHPVPKKVALNGNKAHETVLTFDEKLKPSDIHKALESLGLKPGKPAKGEDATPTGPEVQLLLELPGSSRRLSIERALIDRKTGKTMPKIKWLFTGSATKQPDPNKPETVYAADVTGTLIAVFPITDETVFQSNLTFKDEDLVKLETNAKVLPKEGTDVKLVIQVP